MTNLLDCPVKLTSSTDLAQGLLNYIQSYHEDHVAHPEALKPDLELIKSCRTPIEDKLNINQSTLNSLTRYHAHLAYILPKFPDDVGVEFSYSAIFATSTTAGSILPGELPSCIPIKLSNLKYERACVLFNIAAMTMSLGTSLPRTNTDQLKRAIGFFQQAAGCFRLLRDEVVATIELPPGSPSPPSPDLSNSCLSALEYLSLSQAQESVWQQAVKDQKSNGTISRIAQETSRLYDVTLNFMKDVPKLDIHWIGFAFPEDWISFVQLKSAHFLAVAQFRKGLDDSAAREYGIEVGRLEYACSTLKAAISGAKTCSTETTKTVLQEAKNVFVKLQKSLEQSRRDNDLIYLKQVPSDAELPVIKPVSLVKPTVPQAVSEPAEFLTDDKFGRKLFEQVVPYQVYRIKGVYEDRKKEHLKSAIQDLADSLDSEMVDALRSMNLPGSLEALERPINLPPSLIRSSEELRQKNAPQMLVSMLSSVEQASRANWEALNQITKSLDDEAKEDQQFRTRFGTQSWQRPSSAIANRSLREQEAQLLETFGAAVQSDRSVKERYEHWRNAIELLCQDEDTIRKAIPPVNLSNRGSQDLSLPPTGETELSSPRQLRRLLDDLEDLRGARKRMVGSAVHFANHDSIDRPLIENFKHRLSSAPSSAIEIADDEQIELFIEKQLEKYSKFSDQLEANHRSQNDLIHQIRNVNREFLRSRTDDPVTKARENVFQELDSAYHEFHSIMHNLQEGHQFHSQFNTYTGILGKQVDSYLNDRRRQALGLEHQLNNLHLNSSASAQPRHDSRSQRANGKKKQDEEDCQQEPQQARVVSPTCSSSAGGRRPPSESHRKKQPIRSGAYDPKIHGPPVFSD
ncbi:hypothetical protein PTTG_04471 [Puccinia triticina 1-1 BBBD Race 1]|uniref:BRO1 domain-containing protein n=1 Tax=Puccinia triticina (isolate 1-1 / race 1 (BBBD)) TaxID=630390 RepID=A0A180GH46_PUCT1|nr:hypothetical protein PTTG_04471 [Puccinia triticina 1-1 BBBD Race 1]